MADDNESLPQWLPCGVHTSHSEAEEQRWRSPKFLAETERYRELSKSIIRDLKRPLINLGPYPPFPDTYETRQIYAVKQHFSELKKRLRRDEYLKEVKIYERALSDFLSLPACRRDSAFPLLPSKVLGLRSTSELTTPRTGGPHASQAVQKRNS